MGEVIKDFHEKELPDAIGRKLNIPTKITLSRALSNLEIAGVIG